MNSCIFAVISLHIDGMYFDLQPIPLHNVDDLMAILAILSHHKINYYLKFKEVKK